MSDRYFTLNVRMENAEMQTADALAEALETVVYQLRSIGDSSPVGYSRIIRDVNGQTVGNWRGRKVNTRREAKKIVLDHFHFVSGDRFREADVEEVSASYIRDVIAEVLTEERGAVR